MSISRTSIYVTKYPKVTQEELCGDNLADVRYFCELTEKDSDKTEIDESQDGKYDQFSFSDLKPNTEYNLAFYATNGYYNRDLITKKAHLTVTTKPEYVNPEKPTVTEIADVANPLKTKLKVEFGKHPADSEDSHLKYNIEYYPTNKVFKEKYKSKSFDYPQDGYCEFEVNGGNTYYVSIVVSDPDDDKYSVSSEIVKLETKKIEDSFSGVLLPQDCNYDTFTGTYTWGFVYGNQLGYYKFNLGATAFKERPDILFMNRSTTSSFTPTTGLERKTVNLGHFDVKFSTPDNSDTSKSLKTLFSSSYLNKAPSDISTSWKTPISANDIYNDSIYLHFYRAYSNLYSEELTEDYGAAICFIY